MPEYTPRKGSKSEKILKAHLSQPDLSAVQIAKKVNCSEKTAYGVIAAYKASKTATRVPEARPIAPPSPEPRVEKKRRKKKEPADPGKLPKEKPRFEDGALKGGNGRVDYSITGKAKEPNDVREMGGPVDGLENFSMNVTIIDGNAASNIREARAYLASIKATLAGLDIVDEQIENMPDNIGVNALQVANMLNAAKRIGDAFLQVAKERDEYARNRPSSRYTSRAEWKASGNKKPKTVDPQDAHSPAMAEAEAEASKAAQVN